MMNTQDPNQTINTYLKIIVLSTLIVASFLIAKPFILLLIWAIIVAVALFPFYEKVVKLFHGKKKGLVTTLFVGVLIALIIVPSINMANSVIDSSTDIISDFTAGKIKIDTPKESVKEWPLVGNKLFGMWTDASVNLQAFIKDYPTQVKSSVGWFFDSITGLMGTIVLSLVALIIAGVFMSSAKEGYEQGLLLFNKLTDGHGKEIMKMCTNTIRSVVKGILLVAVVQTIFAYIGFSVIGLSISGVLSIAILICAIIQVPVMLVMIPVIIYVFSFADTTPAVIFAVYAIIVSLLDNVLKPMLLAKGLQTPMIVILIGALGGMMLFGILGLFVGPVVLAVAHRLYFSWVSPV